jgi:hypothetical protein
MARCAVRAAERRNLGVNQPAMRGPFRPALKAGKRGAETSQRDGPYL